MYASQLRTCGLGAVAAVLLGGRCRFRLSEGFPLIKTVKLLAMIVIVILFDGMDLTADLARPECRRMNIGVCGIRGQRIREGIEVQCFHILSRYREDIVFRECAAHASAIQRACLGVGGGLPAASDSCRRTP